MKSKPMLAPFTSPFRSLDGHFLFLSIEMGIKNRREMRSVGFATDFRMYASFFVHENVSCYIANLLFHEDLFCMIKFLATLSSWGSKPQKAVRISAF